jgi:kumamolisin
VTSTRKFTVLAGSERKTVPGARLIHNSHPDQTIEVSIRLRSRAEAKRQEMKSALEQPGFKHMSRSEYENAYGADPADLNQIKKFADEFGLKVHETGTELARRTVLLSGTVSNFQKAFNVELKEYKHPRGNFRGRVGAISVPTDYADIITGVFGLDNRPQAEPHFRLQPQPDKRKRKTHAATTSYDPNVVAQIYDYPPGDGTGQCIALIELGGGFQLDDLSTYFTSLNINVPQVISVSVDGASNSPGNANDDPEVMLDIEVAGAVAPAAKIVVYFAPNTDQGYLDAVTTAVHDTTNNPSVISTSWGGPESDWTTQAMTNLDEAFQAAAAMGVTICAAAGDNGSTDGVNDGNNHVDFPASDPFVLGCGGTTLQSPTTRLSPRPSGTICPTEVQPAAVSATSSPFLPGRRVSMFPHPPFQPADEAYPTSPATPTPTPAITFSSTARLKLSVEPARLHLYGRRWWRASTKPWESRSVSSTL